MYNVLSFCTNIIWKYSNDHVHEVGLKILFLLALIRWFGMFVSRLVLWILVSNAAYSAFLCVSHCHSPCEINSFNNSEMRRSGWSNLSVFIRNGQRRFNPHQLWLKGVKKQRANLVLSQFNCFNCFPLKVAHGFFHYRITDARLDTFVTFLSWFLRHRCRSSVIVLNGKRDWKSMLSLIKCKGKSKYSDALKWMPSHWNETTSNCIQFKRFMRAKKLLVLHRIGVCVTLWLMMAAKSKLFQKYNRNDG